MMKYGFLTDQGITRFRGRILKTGGRVYVNPSPEKLAKAGFKPIVDDPMPEIDAAHILLPVYSDEGSILRRSWRIAPLTEESTTEIEANG